LKNPISSLKDKVTQYIQLKFELIRLEVIERLVNVMGYFAFIIIAIFLFFFLGFFVFLGIAELLASVFESRALGYFSTAGIILILVVMIIMSGKRIIRFFAGRMVAMLTKKKEKKEDYGNNDSEDND
jgi:hypothetical protein